ncbi:type II toxin-antitoxin system RelE/ParE family toxin [Paraburkholderia bannensis]|uniref:type II toxin-antitoxin system RelE/ParE family toxin n=1 Tax=Paraburkholderia bannensis TaxID=765414 RepID=UPI002AC37219|nr:type II toxin-antitoxin system RelE/ParE family toxin [Paraburkholderia bannensis]
MPQVIVTQRATEGLARCERFLSRKSPEAARRAARHINQHLLALESRPSIGRLLPGFPDVRELVIPFGDYGYVALYRHLPERDTVYVLAFRHQRELGY